MELHAIRMFYDQHEGLVELEDDVLSIVRQVRELYGDRIKICHEPTTQMYVFSERCGDGAERLIFTTPELDGRALERLLQADSQLRGYVDAYDRAEHEQDEVMKQRDEEKLEGFRDAGERLAWALDEDGRGAYSSISVSRDIANR